MQMKARDERWLQQILDKVWDTCFADVVQDNDVRIGYGRKAKRRLGSISLDPQDRTISLITINPLFRREDVPEYVVEATIFHELTHYAHGFNSPLAQDQVHPHAGGVMRREYAERGMLDLYQLQKRWLKDNWPRIIAEEFPRRGQARLTSGEVKLPKPFWWA